MYMIWACQILLLLAPSASALQKRSDDLSLEGLETLIQQRAATIQGLQAQVTLLANRLSAAVHTTKVTFTVVLSPGTCALGVNSGPIKFDQVLTNEGSGYNPVTGHFTAPVTGTYAFYAQLMNFVHSPGFHWGLFSSTGATLCHTYLHGTTEYDKATCLATYRLVAGQSVYVVNQDGDGLTVEGNNISSFSGFLLHPE